MSELIRRFRGLGVALVVLALSAGAVFAAAPPFVPASSHASAVAVEHAQANQDEATEEPSEDATEAPETEAPETAPETEAPTAEADATGAPEDTHGALVSAAAQMDTPDGFANHGAFVSCVAHMKDVTLSTVNWDEVTPDACATVKGTPPGQAKSEAARAKAQEKAAAGKAKGQAHAAAGKAKGQANAAAGQSHH